MVWFAAPQIRVFISYRKSDSFAVASEIAQLLRRKLGPDGVFFDDALVPGRDYRRSLRRELRRSTALWAIIGPTWATSTDEQGRLRLFRPDDILRDELEMALARGIPVVPVLLQGVSIPRPTDLPPSLNELDFSRFQGRTVAGNAQLAAEVDRLLEDLRQEAGSRRRGETAVWLQDYGLTLLLLALILGPLLGLALAFPQAALLALVGLAVATVLLTFPVWRFWKIFRLIRDSRFSGVPGRWWKAYQEIWICVLQAWGAPSVAMVARLRTEVALLNPPPNPPAPKIDDAESRRDLSEWREAQQLWQTRVNREVADALEALDANSAERPQLRVTTCFELNNAADGVERYLNLLQILYPRQSAATGKKGFRLPRDEFFCRVEIGQGFLSPQHLIAGLQDHFAEDWRPVLDWYGRAVLQPAPALSEKLRRVQVFQFLCWLMWGPSVPHCSCSQWQSGIGRQAAFDLVLQYGYGDENNSWALIHSGDRGAPLHTFLHNALKLDPGSRGFQCRVVVVPGLPSQFASRVCPAQRDAVEEAPLVLRLLNIAEFEGCPEEVARQIYQAYVWMMFVICDASGEPLFPEEPWRGLLPFFTHGNIADAETYRFVREEVVQKALVCLQDLWASAPEITFRYACSSDDGQCGSPLQFPPARPTMTELLREKAELRLTPAERARLRISDEAVDARFAGRYSACHLSELVHQFYDSLPEFAARDPGRDTLHLED